LSNIIAVPFTGKRKIVIALFLKEKPAQIFAETFVFIPEDLLQVME